MKRNSHFSALLTALFIFLIISCGDSIQPEDGFVIHGTVTDLETGQAISSVRIFIGYSSPDSVQFKATNIISDNLGNYTYYGGPGTAPTDEVLRFEHHDYYIEDVILKNKVTGKNNDYSLSVLMRRK